MKETGNDKNQRLAEALRLADEYAMYFDNQLCITGGAAQAIAARVALADHLATTNQPERKT